MPKRTTTQYCLDGLPGNVEFNGQWLPGIFDAHSSDYEIGPDDFTFKFNIDNTCTIIERQFVRPSALHDRSLSDFWLDGCISREMLRSVHLISLGMHGWDFSYDLPMHDKELKNLHTNMIELYKHNFEGQRDIYFQCNVSDNHDRVTVSLLFEINDICGKYGCDPLVLKKMFKISEQADLYAKNPISMLDCLCSTERCCIYEGAGFFRSTARSQRDGMLVHNLRTLSMDHLRRALKFFNSSAFMKSHFKAVAGNESETTQLISNHVTVEGLTVFRIFIRYCPLYILHAVSTIERAGYLEFRRRLIFFDKHHLRSFARLRQFRNQLRNEIMKLPELSSKRLIPPMFTTASCECIKYHHPHTLNRVMAFYQKIIWLARMTFDDLSDGLSFIDLELIDNDNVLTNADAAKKYLDNIDEDFMTDLDGEAKIVYLQNIEMYRTPKQRIKIFEKNKIYNMVRDNVLNSIDRIPYFTTSQSYQNNEIHY